jgi:putative transposase
VLKTLVRAPRANGVCERFLGSVRRECLDQVLVLGEQHLHEVLVGMSLAAGSSSGCAQ